MISDKNKALKIAGVLLGAFIAGIAIYGIGIILEFEYPYYFDIRNAKSEQTIDDNSANLVISQTLGCNPKDLKWHVCSYCVDRYISLSKNEILPFQVHVRGSDECFYFAFNQIDPHCEIGQIEQGKQ